MMQTAQPMPRRRRKELFLGLEDPLDELLGQILIRAYEDLNQPAAKEMDRRSAERFLSGRWFRDICDALNLDNEKWRRIIFHGQMN